MAALSEKSLSDRTSSTAGAVRASRDKSIGTLANEVKDLVIAYAKQETIDPLKLLGRYLLWGVIGSFLVTVGSVLLTLAALRAIQAETGSHLTGHLAWVPYLGGLLFAAAVLGLTALRISKATK